MLVPLNHRWLIERIATQIGSLFFPIFCPDNQCSKKDLVMKRYDRFEDYLLFSKGSFSVTVSFLVSTLSFMFSVFFFFSSHSLNFCRSISIFQSPAMSVSFSFLCLLSSICLLSVSPFSVSFSQSFSSQFLSSQFVSVSLSLNSQSQSLCSQSSVSVSQSQYIILSFTVVVSCSQFVILSYSVFVSYD